MESRIIKKDSQIYRVFATNEEDWFVMDCIKPSIPKWIRQEEGFQRFSEDELIAALGADLEELTEITPKRIKVMNERFTMIAGLLPFLQDKVMRGKAMESIASEYNISKKTIRRYLCSYLVFMDKRALLPKERNKNDSLTKDEKNMRWSLNKFYYNSHKNTLKYAYRMMLKEKYTDEAGKLKTEYPSFYQFRYFFRKTRKLQTFYISRDGLKAYQKNSRPLLGDGIQSFAPEVGTGMLDSTICDIYLVDDRGKVIGRPILTACIDTYSELCCGYSLTLEGGMYSLRNLMLNVITDKQEYCRKFGIEIERKNWSCSEMPGKLITDKGSEYKSENFEQLTDLGVRIVNLQSYRPDLKSMVEKFFDLVQGYYKPYLRGNGVIEPDFQQRGAVDYRKQACLTLQDFEKVIIHCILFYNSQRIIDKFPYTEDMLEKGIKPYANEIWNYARERKEANLLEVSKKQLVFTLLPRTTAHFTRKGLIVNGLRYANDCFMEEYLQGKEAVVAFNPDNVNSVYLIENGAYIEFELIESRFKDKAINEVQELKDRQKNISRQEQERKIQAEIDLSEHILAIRNSVSHDRRSDIKNIRNNRKKEERKNRKDLIEEVVANE